MFQSKAFQLHRSVPEVTRTVKMFCKNFISSVAHDVPAIDIYDQSKGCPGDEIYPGILAHETLGKMRPHDRASFLTRCRAWYLEAVLQILSRNDLCDPILDALQDMQPRTVVRGVASQTAVGVLARNLPRLAKGSGIQTLDRQWRSMLIDNAGSWETKEVTEFWQSMCAVMEYQALANFILEIMALP